MYTVATPTMSIYIQAVGYQNHTLALMEIFSGWKIKTLSTF